jgi:hypothetical protein
VISDLTREQPVNRSRTAPALPRGFADDLRKEHPSLVAEIVREIRGRIPEYDRPLDCEFGIGLVLGVETALAEFADTIDGRAAPAAQRARVYRALGRTELAEGRSMDSLQSACRLGGRLAWRRYARVARRSGMRPESMVDLAEAVFAHIDQISTASVLGYAEAKADAGETRRHRRRLLELVVAGTTGPLLEQAAESAGWALPRTVACAALGSAPGARTARRPLRPLRHSAAGPVPKVRRRNAGPPDPVCSAGCPRRSWRTSTSPTPSC